MKCAWDFITTRCDHAGIWDVDFSTLSFYLGETVSAEEVETAFGDKIQLIGEDKYFIPSFIEFQYGQIRSNNSVHISVIKRLERLGINVDFQAGYSENPKAVMARLSLRKKTEIFTQDCFRCTYCGFSGDKTNLVVDHIVPRSKGGQNEDHNLTTSCISCNSKKTNIEAHIFIRVHQLGTTISNSLKQKMSIIESLNRSLNGAIKDSQGAKDKEQDKEKDMDKEKDKEQDKDTQGHLRSFKDISQMIARNRS